MADQHAQQQEQRQAQEPKQTAPKPKAEPDKGPDNLTTEELAAHRGDDYAYLDQTRDPHNALHTPMGSDVSAAEVNPAYYPANVKPEAMHGEDEKAGADYPGGPKPGDVEDQSRKAEDLPATKAAEAAEKAKS